MLQIANEEIITCVQFLGLDSPLLCGFMVWQNLVIFDVLS